MEAAEFLFPHDLAVSKSGISKVLFIGSCMAETYVKRFKEYAPEVSFDYMLYNWPAKLPALDDARIGSYDFQYIQPSLRHIVHDEVLDFAGFLADGLAEAVLARGRQLLRLMLESVLQYNLAHNMLTFIGNFMVPQVPVVAALDQVGLTCDFSAIVRHLNEELAMLVRQYRNVYIADIDAIGSSMGKRWFLDDVVGWYSHAGHWGPHWNDFDTSPRYNAPPAGRIDPLPPIETVYESRCEEMFKAVWRQAECMYRTINQIDMVKLVIFDLDDTLWRGQIAEHYGEGMASPTWEGWPPGVWDAVHHLRARGIITALCSKNDENLVRARWDRPVPNWVKLLKLDDFPLRAINWAPKTENVANLIRQASMTPRSAVFVDDNPVERESVRAALPGIRVLGSNPFLTRRILLWSPETQLAFRSAETAGREQSIRQLQLRENDRAGLSREEFLRALQCNVVLREIGSSEHPEFARCLELLNKTNQFNTTGIRWSGAQIATFLGIGGRIFAFHVKDKYADYGLVGTILYYHGNFVQFAMSCRVLGLTIETSVIHALMQHVQASEGLANFSARIMETDANMVCRDVYSRCGFIPRAEDPGQQVRPAGPIPPPAAHLRLETEMAHV
jgi:FkbH-like protein